MKAVLAYGAVRERAFEELTNLGGVSLVIEPIEGALDRVVARASEIASPGDVVLLSPACSSFDMYESYEHRGRHFAELVGRLA